MNSLNPLAAASAALQDLRILVLDDDRATLLTLGSVLDQQSWTVLTATNVAAAVAAVERDTPQLAIIDVFLGDEDGLAYVQQLRRSNPEMGIAVISGEESEILAQKAIDSGADDFMSKPILPNRLMFSVGKLAELHRQRARNLELESALAVSLSEPYPEILTHNDAMKAVLRLVERVSKRELSVLICGESGTGKELIARAIHGSSSRSAGSFVELNCAALPANLVESELFGHERGAFTGAIASRVGKIEQAAGGTLFLDEIGELPLEIQPKLLRSLQEKRITRVGGKKDISCDFRLISATNRDLLDEVRRGAFREDLFYRVAVFPIKLPPLRDRREDIELLLSRFLADDNAQPPRILSAARQILNEYHWPGNIREVKNFAQSITLLADQEIDEASVRSYFGTRLGDRQDRHAPKVMPMFDATARPSERRIRKLEDLEREEIIFALRHYRGGVPEAALALGMGRATLYKYLKRENIELADFTRDATS